MCSLVIGEDQSIPRCGERRRVAAPRLLVSLSPIRQIKAGLPFRQPSVQVLFRLPAEPRENKLIAILQCIGGGRSPGTAYEIALGGTIVAAAALRLRFSGSNEPTQEDDLAAIEAPNLPTARARESPGRLIPIRVESAALAG